MVLLNLYNEHSGIIVDDSVTTEAAARLTGYNIQHIRRLAYAGKLDAIYVGRSWLIKIKSIEAYLNEVVSVDDGRYGPRLPAKPLANIEKK